MKNKDKISYAEFVTMTEDEHNKLIKEYGSAQTARMIEKLDNYKGSVGKKYKSDYRAILNWVAPVIVKEFQNKPKEVSFDVESAERKPLTDFSTKNTPRHKKTTAAY